MKKKINSFTAAGREYNEDSHFINEDFGFVFDGATGVSNVKASNEVTDAVWFTKTWKNYLKNALLDFNKPLKEILKEGIIEIDKLFMDLEKASQVEIKPVAPFSMFRIVRDEVEFFSVGDTSILITYKDKTVKLITQDDVTKLDQANLKIALEIAKREKIDMIDIRPYMAPFLKKTRLKCNKEGGYWSMGSSLKTIDNAIYFKKPVNTIKQIVVMSDGFSQIFDTFNLYSYSSLAEAIEKGKSLESLYKQLYKAQEKDFKANNYPRFKLRDDASVIFIRF